MVTVRRIREFLDMMGMFDIFMGYTAHASVNPHQIVYLRFVHFTVCIFK